MINPKLLEYLNKVVVVESHDLYPQESSFWYLKEDFSMKDLIEAIKDTPEIRQFVMDKVNDPRFMDGT